MKHIIRDICLFIFIQLLLLVVIQLFHFQMMKLKLPAETIYKHQLISMVNGPRLILIGDSNLVLGIRSDMIHEATDYYPINMGLNVSRGLEFMLEEVKSYIQLDDILVISITYAHFREDKTGSRLLEVLANRPESFAYVKEPLSLVSLIPEAIQCNTQEVFHLLLRDKICPSGIYSPSAFNIYGDVVTHRYIDPNPIRDHFSIRLINPQRGFPDQAIDLLNSFSHICDDIGAITCFFLPTYTRLHYGR